MPYSLFSLPFWFFFGFFWITVAVSFYMPGSVVLRLLKLNSKISSAIAYFLLSNVVGLALWGIQGYIFGYAHLRFLTYVYVVIFLAVFVVFWKKEKQFFFQLWREIKKADWRVAAFIIIGSFLQCLMMFGSGFLSSQGVVFFQTNANDGIMHLSYIEELQRQFPPVEPGSYDRPLTNYHYWSDLTMADLSRVWQLPIIHVFFQFMPIFISVLTGIAAYVIIRQWKGSQTAGLWSLFFLYCGGDAAYLFLILLHHTIGFYTPAIDTGVSQFFNVPHTFAKLVFLTGLWPFSQWLKTRDWRWGALSIILFATLAGFKIYFAMFVAVGLVILSIVKGVQSIVQRKNIFKNFPLFLLVGIFALFSAAIYFPANGTSAGLFYAPLEWAKIFLAKDNLDWPAWWNRYFIYQATNNQRGLLILDIIAIIICLLSVYGTRLAGFYLSKEARKHFSSEEILFFYPTCILFTLLGLFTLQSAGLFNVYNFFAVAATVLALFASFTLAALTKLHHKWISLALILFILFTIPRGIHDVYAISLAYAQNKYDALVSPAEIEAFKFMRTSLPANAIVQSHRSNAIELNTPYVSFFSNHETYFSGGRLLETHNQPIKEKQQMLLNIFDNSDAHIFAQEMHLIHVDYVYLLKHSDQQLRFDVHTPYTEPIFENSEVQILKIKPD